MKTDPRWIYLDNKVPREKMLNPNKPVVMTNGRKDIKVDSLYTDVKLKALGYLKTRNYKPRK